jgi:hypothetical protein
LICVIQQEAAVIPTITVVDENARVVTQIDPQQEAEEAADMAIEEVHFFFFFFLLFMARDRRRRRSFLFLFFDHVDNDVVL